MSTSPDPDGPTGGKPNRLLILLAIAGVVVLLTIVALVVVVVDRGGM